MEPPRINLKNLSPDDLTRWVVARDLPRWRAGQIARWLYARGVDDFAAMTDLPRDLRERLAGEVEMGGPRIVANQHSRVDGTLKLLLEIRSGHRVESVIMRHGNRATFCLSSQVGCAVGCPFCQTGDEGFRANLETADILDQVILLRRELGGQDRKFNVVFMGMGEPFLNLDRVLGAVTTLLHPLGFDLGGRRITISTAGYPRRIDRLAATGLNVGLALSLNATTDETRARLMPGVARFSIRETLAACARFAGGGRRRATLEYVLLREVNDTWDDARRLASFARQGPFRVNLIPYNPGSDARFERPTEPEIDRFAGWLAPMAPAVTVRRSRGPDIQAACGQLRGKERAAAGQAPPPG
jgi:23S rRNA (adenine2503-C2)-methyltransferase